MREVDTMKRLAAVVGAVVLSLGLAGCDQFLPEPLAFTLVDSVPVVRTCVPLTISSQEIKNYASDEDYDGYVVFSARGSVALEAGSEFALAAPLDGFTTDLEASAGATTGRFGLSMDVDSREGGAWTTWAHFDGDQLTEGVWVDSYGEVLQTPCTHTDCSRFAACFNNWPEPTGLPTRPVPTFAPVPTGEPVTE